MQRTPKDTLEKIEPLYKLGLLGKDIAKELNLPAANVIYHLKQKGLVSHKYVNKTKINKFEKEILKLYYEGKSGTEIGESLVIPPGAIRAYLKKKNLPSNYKAKRVLCIENNKGLCHKCNKWIDITLFQKGRIGTPKEYTYAYCNTCRNTKVKNRLKTDFSSYVTTLAGRLKRKKCTLPFDLTKEYILDLFTKQEGKCFYSGYNLIFGQKVGLCPYSLSVDKIIPELGYVQGNIVLCSHRINAMKSNATLEEMKEWMPGWYEKLKNAPFVTVVLLLEGEK